MSTQKNPTEHPGTFEKRGYSRVVFGRGDGECKLLEERYPGIRFNLVEIIVDPEHRLKDLESSGNDYVTVSFNISGTDEAIKRHGFDRPNWIGGRTQSRTGRSRLWMASYDDGLDWISQLLVPKLLASVIKPRT